MNRLTDKIVFLLILVMVSLPFSIAKIPIIGEVYVKAYISLFILITLVVQFFSRKKISTKSLVTYIIPIFIFYIVFSMIIGRDITDIIMQSLLYTPFLAACFIITNGTSLRIDVILKWIIYSVTLSGLTAIFIFYFNPSLIPSKLLSEADILWGRLPWGTAANVLISLNIILYLTQTKYKKNQPIITLSLPLIISATISIIPAILTFNRTFLLALIGSVFLSFIYSGIKNKLYPALSIILIAYISIGFFDFENVKHLFESRVLNFLTLKADNSGHINDRIELYDQYYDVFLNYPIFGAGFGVPFATVPDVSFYSDITLVSFMLPFGLFGLFIFGYYIYTLWSIINKSKSQALLNFRLAIKSTIFFALLISLNDDIWSHKEFVLILALIIASFSNYCRQNKGI